jgi:hypothetical protein
VDIDSDCPCGPCVSGRKKLEEERQAAKKNAEPPKPESDADIHARHKDEKSEAKVKKDGKGNDQVKSQGKKKVVETSDTAEEGEKASGEKGSNPSKKKAKGANKKQPEPTEEESSSEDTEDEPPKAQSKKKDKKKVGSTKSNASEHRGKKKEKKEKRSAAAPSAHLPPRRPDLLMPVQARVLQVEHSIEGAEDPRPNAFCDLEHGVMRVYHGPVYGNVYGALYPKRVSGTLPMGTPHPTQNPYLYGFAPPGFPASQATPGAVAPSGAGGQHQHPWFQAWGTTTVPGVPPQTPANPRDAFNESPSLRANAKKDNNIVPFQAPSINSGGPRKADSSKPADVQNDKGFDGNRLSSGDKDGGNNISLDKPYSPADSHKIDESLDRMRASKNGSKSGSKANTPQVASNSGSKQGSKQPTPSRGSPSQVPPSTAGNVAPVGEGGSTINQGSPSLKPPSTAGNIGPSNSGGGDETAADNSGSQDADGHPRHHRRTNTNEVCPPGSWSPQKQNETMGGNDVFNGDSKQNFDPVAAPIDDSTWANNNSWADDTMANTTGGFWDSAKGKNDARVIHNTKW